MTWTILNQLSKNKRRYYTVQCNCGYVGERRKDLVDSGRTTECKVCSTKRTSRNYGMPSNFKGIEGLSMTHYSHIKNGANKRGLSFSVSINFLWELFVKQKGKCALTGVDLVLVPKIKNTNANWSIITASVDRIDSDKGYEENNVQWVHKEINRFKNNYSMLDFLSMCSLVVHHVNPDPSVVNANIVTTKEQRLEGEEATNNPSTSAQQPRYSEGWFLPPLEEIFKG